jgi:hypothetical protein
MGMGGLAAGATQGGGGRGGGGGPVGRWGRGVMELRGEDRGGVEWEGEIAVCWHTRESHRWRARWRGQWRPTVAGERPPGHPGLPRPRAQSGGEVSVTRHCGKHPSRGRWERWHHCSALLSGLPAVEGVQGGEWGAQGQAGGPVGVIARDNTAPGFSALHKLAVHLLVVHLGGHRQLSGEQSTRLNAFEAKRTA